MKCFWTDKKRYDVGITVLTYNIPEEILNRFIDSVKKSSPNVRYFIHYTNENCECKINGDIFFNRNMGHNYSIKKIAPLCKTIICADVDLIVPPGYIDYSHAVCLSREFDGFSGIIRNAPDNYMELSWEELDKVEKQRVMAFGPWTALRTEDWFKIGGWNENLYSWGYDRHIFDRCIYHGLNMKRDCIGPLMHPPHKRRNKSIKGIDPERVKLAQQTIGEKFI